MSKKNIFIVIFFALITVASFATADYIDPSGSAPNNNTSAVLKTESEKPVASSRPSRFVIEAKKGAFDNKGVKVGDLVKYLGDTLVVIPLGG